MTSSQAHLQPHQIQFATTFPLSRNCPTSRPLFTAVHREHRLLPLSLSGSVDYRDGAESHIRGTIRSKFDHFDKKGALKGCDKCGHRLLQSYILYGGRDTMVT